MRVRLPWARPWLWPALWKARRARRATAEYREIRARVKRYGCTCGRATRWSPAARRRRAFVTCPDLGCTREVAEHVQAVSPSRRLDPELVAMLAGRPHPGRE